VARIIVVRSTRQASSLAERLETLGHEVVRCPLIEFEPLGEGPVSVAGYDWLVITSPNGADELARRLPSGALPRVAAVGRGTAEALREHGIRVDLVASVSSQEGLLAEFPRSPGRVLVAAAEGARRTLADGLGADFLPLYRTVELRPAERPEGDLAVLASSSQARAFAALGLDVPVVSIGPLTTDTARSLGLRVLGEAETHDLDGLTAAVARASAQ
jgi:uroporphyrinogen III methyltransferase / synthase